MASKRSTERARRHILDAMEEAVRIVPFEDRHAADFARINRRWLEAYSLLEELDEPHLRDPRASIVTGGGEIFIALAGEAVVGTCGVHPLGPVALGRFEIVKLTVDETMRGQGVGRRLLEHAIAFARAAGARELSLSSNSQLVSALRLYEALGFRRLPVPAALGATGLDLRPVPPDDASAPGEVTRLLRAWRGGDAMAHEELLRRVYDELKRIAGAHMRGERGAHTLQPTALVHEAYLRLLGQTRIDWRDRTHFFGIAAAMMRRVLVDHARARLADKRAHQRVTLTGDVGVFAGEALPPAQLLDLDRALDRLAAAFPRPARVVELHFFSGLELAEVAVALEVALRTVMRDWSFARAWLRRELAAPPQP
jgi:RNA polymerase sigma factor (TIGR02999 family)